MSQPEFVLIEQEPVLIAEVTGSVGLFTFSLDVGSKLIIHKKSMRYHRHEKEVDLIITGSVGVGEVAPKFPGDVRAAIAQGFVSAEAGVGRKVALVFKDRPPYSFHFLEGGSENVSVLGVSAGVRSLFTSTGKFASWNQKRSELTIYEGTGGKLTTPPSHHIQAWARRFEAGAASALLAVLTESASVAFFDGTQSSYRVSFPKQ